MVYYYSAQLTNFLDKEITVWQKPIEELVTLLSKEKEIVIDCETTGLNPLIDKIVMFQIGTKTDQYVIDIRGFSVSKHLKSLLENKEILKIGHNIKFDYNMLKRYDIVLDNVYDTMIADMVIFNGKYSQEEIKASKRFSLAGVYDHYFKREVVKTTATEFLTIGNSPFTNRQILYGAKDVQYPLEIKEVQSHWISKYNLRKKISLENKVVLAIGDIEYNGFHVDSAKWLTVHASYDEKIKKTLLELDNLLIEEDDKFRSLSYQLSLFEIVVPDRLTSINWNSGAQVYSILTKTFDIWPEDKDGKPSTSTKALELLLERPPFVKALLKYRKEAKVISSFGKEFIEKYLHSDSRLRTSFNQMVATGRMSSRNPNMQQIPKGDEFRGAFVALPGKQIITADYSNQEQRCMCDKADDENFIDFFNKGGICDLHSYIAQTMFSAAEGKFVEVPPKPDTDDTPELKAALAYHKAHPNAYLRQKGKIIGFMISFGGSAFALSKSLKISVEEAEGLINSYFKGFPKLKQMFDKSVKFALQNGYIIIDEVTNGIRWLPEFEEYRELITKDYTTLSKEERSKKAKLEGRMRRKAMNTPIQGMASSITKTALLLQRNYLLEAGIRPLKDASIKMVAVVHDRHICCV